MMSSTYDRCGITQQAKSVRLHDIQVQAAQDVGLINEDYRRADAILAAANQQKRGALNHAYNAVQKAGKATYDWYNTH